MNAPQNWIAPQTGQEPRTYRATGFWRIAMILCSVVLSGGSGAGVWAILAANDGRVRAAILMTGICLAFTSISVYCLLWTIRGKIVLYPGSVSIQGPFRTRDLRAGQISGWRITPTAPPTLIFQMISTTGDRSRTAKVSLLFPLDEEFVDWLSKLPSLDDQEAETSTAEILDDPRFGNTPSEMEEFLQRGKAQARILNSLACIVSAWGFFYPRPYVASTLALATFPALALAVIWRSDGFFRADERRNDIRPNLALAILLPSMILCLLALRRNVLSPHEVLAWCVAVTAVFMLAAWKGDPATLKQPIQFAIFCAIGTAYAYGATVQINTLKDRAPRSTYRAIAQGKHVTRGKRTSYYVDLGPWKLEDRPEKLEIGEATYNEIKTGDVSILTARHGWLGIDWYYMSGLRHEGGAKSAP